MKFKPSDIVFDPRLNMAGMIMGIEESPERQAMSSPLKQSWYKVMLFGDSWCVDGKTRDYTVQLADNLLEIYNEEEHKGLTRDEAEHDVDELSVVYLNDNDDGV